MDFKLTDTDARSYSRTRNHLLHLDMPSSLENTAALTKKLMKTLWMKNGSEKQLCLYTIFLCDHGKSIHLVYSIFKIRLNIYYSSSGRAELLMAMAV